MGHINYTLLYIQALREERKVRIYRTDLTVTSRNELRNVEFDVALHLALGRCHHRLRLMLRHCTLLGCERG